MKQLLNAITCNEPKMLINPVFLERTCKFV